MAAYVDVVFKASVITDSKLLALQTSLWVRLKHLLIVYGIDPQQLRSQTSIIHFWINKIAFREYVLMIV
jgi:hypothetical protein